MSVVSTGKAPTVLVTGATGFLGSRLVEKLLWKGYRVRALARKTSRIDHLKGLEVDICYGDVADLSSLENAFKEINFVVHAAADTKGDKIKGLQTSIDGTQNIVSLSKKYNISKLVYISSCSVYGVSELGQGQIVDENSTMEKHSEKRGIYSEAKVKTERILIDTSKNKNIPFVCLRPGTILGEGGHIFTPMMGFSLGKKLFAIIGNGQFILPLVYIDNLVEAIILALGNKNSTGQIYNVVDFDRVTKKEYVNTLLRKLYPKAIFLYLPYSLLYIIAFFQEIIFGLLKRQPYFTRYRLISSQRSVVYDSSKIKRYLDWNPATTLREAIGKVLTYEQTRANNKLHKA